MPSKPRTELELCEQRLKDLYDLVELFNEDIKKFRSSPVEEVQLDIPRHEAWVKRCLEVDIPETKLRLQELKK